MDPLFLDNFVFINGKSRYYNYHMLTMIPGSSRSLFCSEVIQYKEVRGMGL